MANGNGNGGGTGNDSALFAAAMRAAAGLGWRRTRLADIAGEAGLSLAELHGRYASKQALLDGLVRHIDRTVLAGVQQAAAGEAELDGEPGGDLDGEGGGSCRDRLFDILMQRFDALNPYRDGLRAVLRDAGSGGVAEMLCGGCRLLRSMRWMLEAAGIDTTGWRGGLRVKGLAVVFAATVRVWLRDDSADMAPTMAALDRNLRRAERLATMQPPFGRRRADPGSFEAGPAPAA